MADTLLDMNSLTMPPGYCWPASVQSFVDHITNNMKAVFPGTLTSFNYGDSTPDTADQDKPWIHTGHFRLYVWSGDYNAWIAPHPLEYSSGFRAMFVGTTVQIDQLDGGVSGEAVGDATGPFWEIDTNLSGRVPLGVGTLAVSGVAIASGTTGGVDQMTLTSLQVPNHNHSVYINSSDGVNSTIGEALQTVDQGDAGGGETPSYKLAKPSSSTTYLASWGGNPANSNAADPFSIMPPYYGVYFIKRTARKYFKAS